MAEIYSPIHTPPAYSHTQARHQRPFGQSFIQNQLPIRTSQPPQKPLLPAASPTPPQGLKRRHSDDEDEAMDSAGGNDRSAKRKVAPLKKPRLEMSVGANKGKTGLPQGQEAKRKEDQEDDIDVGVLLASLPPSAHLPLILSILDEHPSIRKTILSKIPKPGIDFTRDALVDAAKKLKEAVPYSVPSSNASLSFVSEPQTPTTPTKSGSTLGLGFTTPTPTPNLEAPNGLREEYAIGRLRPAIQTLCTAISFHLPYYSMVAGPVSLASLESTPSSSSTPLTYPKNPSPSASETFLVLSSLTSAIITLPPLALQGLKQHGEINVIERVIKEWKGWLEFIDKNVNDQGGIYGREMASGWIDALDSFALGKSASPNIGIGSTSVGWGAASWGASSVAAASSGWGNGSSSSLGWGSIVAPSPGGIGFGFGGARTQLPQSAASTSTETGPKAELISAMKEIRDTWINKVGWLVGRHPPTGEDSMMF